MNTNKFQDIYLDIKSKILAGDYIENESIESEHQLASKYLVTRETVRRALSILQAEKYIKKNRVREVLYNRKVNTRIRKSSLQKKKIYRKFQ